MQRNPRFSIGPALMFTFCAYATACGTGYQDESYGDEVGGPEVGAEAQTLALTGPGGGILCPTTIRLSDGTQAGPVTAELTNTLAVCRVENPPRIYTDPVGIDPNLGTFTELVRVGLRAKVYVSGTSLKAKAYRAGILIGTYTIYTCPETHGSGSTSADSWNGRSYQLGNAKMHYNGPSGTHTVEEAFSGTFQCSWQPDDAAVDFPRQFREDNRDISVNLNRTGFYRVYHMHDALWEDVCVMQCSEGRTCAPGPYGCIGLGEAIAECVDDCVDRGW